MTVLSRQTIRRLGLLTPCLEAYRDPIGNSAGLSVASYDLTLSQAVTLVPGTFVLASAVERFSLPDDVIAVVHDKSSLARRGIAVQNTLADCGWHGYLTLEISNHSSDTIVLPEGAAIAQVVFHFLDAPSEAPYRGKYQDQGPEPVGPRVTHSSQTQGADEWLKNK
jgi:dCTP deaminase